MKLSELLQKSSKTVSSEEVSKNAKLLTRAGYVNKLMAGVYSYLPLGLKVMQKIENIVREEMMAIGSQEIFMPSLSPRENWEKTGRIDTIDVIFTLKGAGDKDYVLCPTHEEIVTPLVANYVNSYKELPLSVFQVQTKFRNELRAKSGILRGREFRMKDMYSFHVSEADLDEFYEKAIIAYKNVYARCGIGDKTLLTFASGGAFSKYSHEFQTITDAGEDIIYKVPGTDIAINEEVIDDKEAIASIIPGYKPGDEKTLETVKAVEVGNIFKLGTKYSSSFGAKYLDDKGEAREFIMGCYGIGITRLMGAVVECLGDENGLVWPREIAPYDVHLVSLANSDEETRAADEIYQSLKKAGVEVLYDDRPKLRAGEKFADSDLIGLPYRVVVSSKTLAAGTLEVKERTAEQSQNTTLDALVTLLKK